MGLSWEYMWDMIMMLKAPQLSPLEWQSSGVHGKVSSSTQGETLPPLGPPGYIYIYIYDDDDYMRFGSIMVC